MSKNKKWTMPDWMEPYRGQIGNTGGNAVEDLIDRLATDQYLSKTNFPVFVLAVAVESQVHLLERLRKAKKI
jgi:hypothetical protein